MSQEERLNLLFSGEVTLSTADAVQTLCQLFKVPTDKAHQLLSQKSTLTIKRNLSPSEALSLQRKLEKRGIITRTERVPPANNELGLIPIEPRFASATEDDSELPSSEHEDDVEPIFDIGLILHKTLAIFGIIVAAILVVAFLPDQQTQLRRGLVLGLILLFISYKRFVALRERV